MTARPIRVVVIDDSITVRKRLVQVLAEAPDIEVVGEAADGREGFERVLHLRPDVVTLDMAMPGMNGTRTAEQIMAYCPTPILVVSASQNRGAAFDTLDALGAGAVDVYDKPLGPMTGAWVAGLIEKVRMVSRIRVITHARALVRDRLASRPGLPARRLVAIGASTGGPSAVMEILRGLGPLFDVPILLVLHIGAPFGNRFADWLASVSPLPVRIAAHGEILPSHGRLVLVPPIDRHMKIVGDHLCLTEDPPRHASRPSVDVLFESVAVAVGSGAIGCLLTGMGRDGAAGLLAMRRAGAMTIAQDEATSTVYGMPREAVGLGAATHVLPLQGIGGAIRAAVVQG